MSKIEKLLNENLESFYPWSDNDTPPLDTNKKTFVEKEREIRRESKKQKKLAKM